MRIPAIPAPQAHPCRLLPARPGPAIAPLELTLENPFDPRACLAENIRHALIGGTIGRRRIERLRSSAAGRGNTESPGAGAASRWPLRIETRTPRPELVVTLRHSKMQMNISAEAHRFVKESGHNARALRIESAQERSTSQDGRTTSTVKRGCRSPLESDRMLGLLVQREIVPRMDTVMMSSGPDAVVKESLNLHRPRASLFEPPSITVRASALVVHQRVAAESFRSTDADRYDHRP